MAKHHPSFRKLEGDVLRIIKQAKAERKKKMSNRLYDILKWVALTLIPASATFIALLGSAWGWPEVLVGNVVLTITGSGAFLGALLGISHIKYVRDNEDLL